jgi:hypothetical protein
LAKRIITEKDVLNMRVPAEIVLDGDTIATPSALDAAYTRGIRVIYRKRESGPRGHGPIAGDARLASRISGLPDGNYLLQVREGKSRIFQIKDNGVFPLPGM